jgi:branched-chain amino acid aminotransferase
MSTPSKYMLVDGAAVHTKDAVIPIGSPAVAYAAAVFEGVRAYWSDSDRQLYVFRLDEHLERLRASMRIMRFGVSYTMADLRAQVLQAIRVNELREDIHLRVVALVDGPTDITASGTVRLAISAGPYPPNRWVDRGVAAAISSWHRISDASMPPRVKATGNYSNGRLAMLQAREDGYDVALMLSPEGKLAEAPVAACFMVRHGIVSTPLVSDGVLESVTRATLLDLFSEHLGTQVLERRVDRTELYDCDELFLCGSGWEITPVASVDRIGMLSGAPGPVTTQIRSLYMDAVRGRLDTRRGWLTPVW